MEKTQRKLCADRDVHAWCGDIGPKEIQNLLLNNIKFIFFEVYIYIGSLFLY